MCQPRCMASDLTVSWELLRAAAQLIAGIQSGVEAKGFGDVRPVHGYAFARISAGDATVADVAENLGVTKQAASQLVDHLVRRGYVERAPHPEDARARLLTLTDKGHECTRAAERAASGVVAGWRREMGLHDFDVLQRALG